MRRVPAGSTFFLEKLAVISRARGAVDGVVDGGIADVVSTPLGSGVPWYEDTGEVGIYIGGARRVVAFSCGFVVRYTVYRDDYYIIRIILGSGSSLLTRSISTLSISSTSVPISSYSRSTFLGLGRRSSRRNRGVFGSKRY